MTVLINKETRVHMCHVYMAILQARSCLEKGQGEMKEATVECVNTSYRKTGRVWERQGWECPWASNSHSTRSTIATVLEALRTPKLNPVSNWVMLQVKEIPVKAQAYSWDLSLWQYKMMVLELSMSDLLQEKLWKVIDSPTTVTWSRERETCFCTDSILKLVVQRLLSREAFLLILYLTWVKSVDKDCSYCFTWPIIIYSCFADHATMNPY